MPENRLLPNTLVSTLWLDQNLTMPDLRVVDIRGKVLPATEPEPHYFSHEEAYHRSHIPGAVFVNWITDITVDGPHKMAVAPPEKFAALMGSLGIDNKTFVVAYDDAGGMFAARLWWMLNYYGHDKVAVLNGGWDKWVNEARPTTDAVPEIEPVTFIPEVKPSSARSADDIQAALNSEMKLVDVRTALEYTGGASRAKRAGHIPGAVNTPRKSLLAADGTLLPEGVLQDLFNADGIQSGDDVVFYCNGGVSASFGLLAYRVAFGDGGMIYDGSWKEWGNDPARPLETESE